MEPWEFTQVMAQAQLVESLLELEISVQWEFKMQTIMASNLLTNKNLWKNWLQTSQNLRNTSFTMLDWTKKEQLPMT